MRCPTIFFMGLTGIKIPYTSVPGSQIRSNLKIISDNKDIARLIGQHLENIGKVEFNFLCNSAKALIFERSAHDMQAGQISTKANALLIQNIRELQSWLFNLWLIKDNAVNMDTGWFAVVTKNETAMVNNLWSTKVTSADGKFDAVSFTAEEIQATASLSIPVEEMTEEFIELDIALRPEVKSTKLSSQSLRFQRFMYFIGAARSTADVAIKIAHYCTALESMVSSAQSELSHQVAQRTACLLHMNGEQRLSTFRIVKQGYNFRSKSVHGATFKDKELDQLKEVSTKIDQIVRNVARIYLADLTFRDISDGNLEHFEQFWLKRIFLHPDSFAPDSEKK